MRETIKTIKTTEEVKKMRKTFLTMFLILLSVLLMYGYADAISGVCSGCHTMHNSQNGESVTGGAAVDLLLKSTCVGCHTSGSAIGPRVDSTILMPAGGSFDTTTIAVDSPKRHDVQDLSLTETVNVTATPGNTGDSIMTVGLAELTCAGAKGCHGKHVTGMDSDAGIKGSHHAPGTTFRFLWIGTTATPDAVLGTGDADYELTVSNSDHNVYSAHATQGISYFCNQCHGVFHGTGATETGGTVGPWKRHPTDYALFTGGAAWNSSSTNLNAADAPIGLIDVGANLTSTNYYQDGTIDTTNSAVICISCHRAHGSANNDLLRWSYDSSAGSNGDTKCLSCHYLQK
jgi:predicted CXXCH cytochrome family protein